MPIDLTPLLSGRLSVLYVEDSFVPDAADPEMPLLPADMTLEGPVRLCGSVTNKNGYMSLDGLVSVPYLTRCDRCLGDVRGTLEFPFRRLVVTPDRIGRKTASEDGIDPDELLTLTDCFLDADRAIAEEVALELPLYHLCRPDCPGLCPRCGKRLADGPCGCVPEKEINPKLAILQKLLDNSEKK